jgi:hypothetical protein
MDTASVFWVATAVVNELPCASDLAQRYGRCPSDAGLRVFEQRVQCCGCPSVLDRTERLGGILPHDTVLVAEGRYEWLHGHRANLHEGVSDGSAFLSVTVPSKCRQARLYSLGL